MTFVVVGAGLAGGKAVETLRDQGYDGRIVLIGSEESPPYERPPLSKGLLLGTAERDSVFVHTPQWYADHDVDLRTGTTVTGLSPEKRLVAAGGEEIVYDRLLLTTGASPRRLSVPGGERALLLRTLGDSEAIARAATDGSRIVVIGAGWIGLEVAAAARSHGAAVTVVETASLPLQRVLGDTIATIFADLHREHGVEFHFGAKISEITATHVLLADGTALPFDAVIAGVGVTPNVDLAAQAGLAVDNGVLVDRQLRTSDPAIFAAGDVANVDHPLLKTRIRVEHWANALHSGPAAARAMLDQDVSYDRLPYFCTDQYDLGMEYTGWVPPGIDAEVVVRGDLASRSFIAFWLVEGKVAAGMNVNIWDVNDAIADLVRAGAVIDRGRLADPGLALEELLP
ncbi:FAD-dependent oxidoreductase [Actinoplanes sp. NPDC051633]|uniref:NAD(P)/FAD-dependent oxidoreductase n=1 Tax=Actinoplanes sp. NPDC051633 TaxID=3155670 RepID=UPI003440F3C5